MMPTDPPPKECPLGECLSLIGGTWTPNIIWYLSGTPRRFSELKRDLAGISGKVLTTRLRKLERDGIVTRRVEPTSPPTVTYELTDLGGELRPVIDAIIDVGLRLKTAKQERLNSVKIQSIVDSSIG
jgi:DNA-binding HxlR family transcriptional regulator